MTLCSSRNLSGRLYSRQEYQSSMWKDGFHAAKWVSIIWKVMESLPPDDRVKRETRVQLDDRNLPYGRAFGVFLHSD